MTVTQRGAGEEGVQSTRWAWFWVIIALLVTAVTAWWMALDVIPWLRGPAPFPPEWDWPYRPLDWANSGTWVHSAAFVVYAGVVLAIMHPTLLRWGSERQRRTVAVALAVVGFLGLQLALAVARKGDILELILFRTYAPPGNGYFMTAVRVDSVWDTLLHYQAAMPNFPHDRPQTHPPGIFMYYAAFNYLFDRLPDFSQWFAAIARSRAPADRTWVELKDAYVTSAFFSGAAQWLLACLAPLSFYAFLRRLDSRATGAVSTFAVWGAMLLPLLPAVSSFYSHWDVNYLLLASAAWFFALRGQDRLHQTGVRGIRRWLDWGWSGLLLSLLTWLSFGNAVLCGMIGLHLLWRELLTLRAPGQRFDVPGFGRFVAGAAILTAGVILPWLLAFVFWNMNYFGLFRTGMQAHYAITTSGRDFNIWRWMNLVDYTLWVGPGVVLLGLVATVWLLAHLRRGELESNLAGLMLVVWFVILVLDLSGTARAEIGRLWIFLMPFPLLAALGYLRTYGLRAALLCMLALSAWVMGFALRAV